jgi:hypothetical protein
MNIIDHNYVITTLGLPGKIEATRNIQWDNLNKIVTVVFFAIAFVGIIVAGCLIRKYLVHFEEIKPRVFKPITDLDQRLLTLSNCCIIAPLTFLMATPIAFMFGGMSLLCRKGYHAYLRTTYLEKVGSFLPEEGESLSPTQLHRFFDEAPENKRREIFERCLEEREFAILQEKVGRDQLLAWAHDSVEYLSIANLYQGDWRANFKNFDYSTLKDNPKKEALFYHLAKGLNLGKRLLIAKWMYESNQNRQAPEYYRQDDFSGEGPSFSFELGLWKAASPYLLRECKPGLVEGENLNSVKAQILFIFRLRGMHVAPLINALFDETEVDDNQLVQLARDNMSGFFKEALQPLLT